MCSEEESAYHQLCAYTLSRRDPGFVHQFVVDCWALQHSTPETRPIGMVFPLVSLYLHLEHGYTGRQAQLAHMRLGNNRRTWPRMTPPAQPVHFSVNEILDLNSDAARDHAIDRWCELTWDAWKDSQGQIRELVQGELNLAPKARQ